MGKGNQIAILATSIACAVLQLVLKLFVWHACSDSLSSVLVLGFC